MTHLKRHKSPKNWPISRKGTTFVVTPNSDTEKGIPILIILRDLLKIAQNRKEVKRALYEKNILINKRAVRDDKQGVVLFDVIEIIPSKENYRITLNSKGKFAAEKISENETKNKIAKVINKKILKGKKVQINLSDGNNIISDMKCNVNDSLLINLEKKKIEKCLELKEKAKIMVFGGKHSGKKGVIESIKNERKMAKINVGEEKINVLIKQLIVIE